jgi:hypothetical protein
MEFYLIRIIVEGVFTIGIPEKNNMYLKDYKGQL